MPERIQTIEEEIKKLEARMEAMKNERPDSKQDRHVQQATLSLLKDVVRDLRKQQKKLRKAGAGQEE